MSRISEAMEALHRAFEDELGLKVTVNTFAHRGDNGLTLDQAKEVSEKAGYLLGAEVAQCYRDGTAWYKIENRTGTVDLAIFFDA